MEKRRVGRPVKYLTEEEKKTAKREQVKKALVKYRAKPVAYKKSFHKKYYENKKLKKLLKENGINYK